MKHLRKYKLFEAYPPNSFEIESERLFKKLEPDVSDILLELEDNGIKVDINKYIDDFIFEFQVEIEYIKTTEQKQISKDAIIRLESFLYENGLELSLIEMRQMESNYTHEHELRDIEEIVDLENAAGEISLFLYFSKNVNS